MLSFAVQLAVVRELENRVADAKSALKETFLSELAPGDAKAARLEDGTVLGKVSVVDGRTTVKVVDEAAFLAWVRETHPTEVVESVRESFRKQVLSSGEVPPGCDVVTGKPYVSYRAAKGAGEVITQRWRELVPGIPQISGGE